MHGGLLALTQGWKGLAIAFAGVQLPMMAALIRSKAAFQRLLMSPFIAAPATLAVGAGIALLSPPARGAGFAVSGTMQFALGLGFCIGTGYAAGRLLGRADIALRSEVGTRLKRDAQWRPGKQSLRADELSLAGVRVALADETKHFKFIGTTGTGKSTAIAQLLDRALARGDRAVIADPDGGYLRRFYDAGRGDIILNPFDQRSRRWDLFAEIRREYDVDQLARSLIPDHEGADRSWRGYGRTFFTAVTRQACACGVRDPKELYRLLTIADSQELATLTRGTPAQPFLEANNARMFDSLRSVTSSAVASLEYVANQQSDGFSIRQWVEQERAERPGVLFIPYRAGQIAALRPAISAWMRIAIFSAMDRPEGDQRLWFVVDELDALGPIDGLKDALARVRKFGGRCVLGFQSIAQVASTYGEGEARTIVENCGNSLILRCSASDGGGTSRFASTLIGQHEVRRSTSSRSTRDTEFFGSSTRAEHYSIEPAVMDSEIEQIPDLCGFLKLAGQCEWLRIRLNPPNARAGRATEVPAFVPAPVAMPSAAPTATPAVTPAVTAAAGVRRRRSRSAASAAAASPAAAAGGAKPRARRASEAAPTADPANAAEPRGFEP